jgi:uncharacterized protein YcnI
VRAIRWTAVLGTATLAAILAAGTAWAHVEVSSDKKQAGATDVTVTFTGEAESNTAGLKSARVVLPDGIAPSQVKLTKAPSGWTFTELSDGFRIKGKPLPIGIDAVWSILIDKLPDNVTELPFKTVETYGDGEIANWIEVPSPGQQVPDPAPILTLAPASGAASSGASASSGVSASVSPAASGQSGAAGTTARAPADSSSNSGLIWTIVGIVVAVAVIAGLVIWGRRRRSATG